MRHLRILVTGVMTGTALLAFGTTASATTLDTATGGALKTGSKLDLSLKPKTSTVFSDTSGVVQNTCTSSTAAGQTANETGVTVTVTLESWTFEGCTRAVKTIRTGILHVAWISGTSNGTVTGSAFEYEANTPFGLCIYGFGTGTHLGTLSAASSSTTYATLVIKAVLPLVETVNGTCASDSRWVAEYTATTPTGLTVKE